MRLLRLRLLPRRQKLLLRLLRLARLQHWRFVSRVLRNTLWLRSKGRLMRCWLLVLVRMSLLLTVEMLLMRTQRSSAAVAVARRRWLRERGRRHLPYGGLRLLRGLVRRWRVASCGGQWRIEAEQCAQGVFVRLSRLAHVSRGVGDSLAVRRRGLLCRLRMASTGRSGRRVR